MAIVGASGPLGKQLVARALDRGYRVSALVRDPSGLGLANERVTTFKVDAATGEGFAPGLSNCSVVVCTVGSLKPIMSACMTNLVEALAKKKTFLRLVMVSRLGAAESLEQSARASGAIQSHLPMLLASLFRDLTLAEAVVKSSKLPYTIIRPARLTDDPPSSKVIAVGADQAPPHRVSRVDLARFIVDSFEDKQWVGRVVTVGAAER